MWIFWGEEREKGEFEVRHGRDLVWEPRPVVGALQGSSHRAAMGAARCVLGVLPSGCGLRTLRQHHLRGSMCTMWLGVSTALSCGA